ncbi:MAG: hypothetical protein KDB80_17185 [Planctomycetes bacterium]|nr:hypothetical protein [Planctomycetota bacterium]
MHEFFPFVVVGFIALAIVLAVFGHLAAKKRREALAAFAAEIGWDFDPSSRTHDSMLAPFEQFQRGHSRRAFNTLSGTLEARGFECDAQAGDFLYKRTSGSGKNRRTTTYRFSYLVLDLPFRSVPDLLIRREGLFDKLTSVLGFDDIDFESEEFSRKFFVKSRDRKFAYDLVDPRMMEFLLATRPPRIDLEAGFLCMTDGSSRWEPNQFGRQFETAREFLDRWPAHLVDRLES